MTNTVNTFSRTSVRGCSYRIASTIIKDEHDEHAGGSGQERERARGKLVHWRDASAYPAAKGGSCQGTYVLQTAERTFSSSHANSWQIKAFALNRMDITQREGNYPGIPHGTTDILGVEFSGHITALGPDTLLGWQTGDEVLGLTSGVSRILRREFLRKNPTSALMFRPGCCTVGRVRRIYRRT